jgi:hypothetical protein
MISLNRFLPQISGFLNTTPDALYERQRQLVRLGILTAEQGRGPGSGVKLSADGVAALLVALLVTDNLSDTDDRILRLLASKPVIKSATDAKTLWEELSVLLLSPQKLRSLAFIEVDRNMLLARVWYLKGKKPVEGPLFAPSRPRDVGSSGIDVRASIGSKHALLPISLALIDALGIHSPAKKETSR